MSLCAVLYFCPRYAGQKIAFSAADRRKQVF